jgi:hypothetical protein
MSKLYLLVIFPDYALVNFVQQLVMPKNIILK